MTLFDIMRQAGGGEAFKAYAKLFGISEEQAAKAVEAFMPAFSLGLKQNAGDPLGFAEMMRRFTAGDYRAFFAEPEKAPKMGADILNFMLGSQEIVRKIAEQASLATGIATETLKAMMPAVAATMMGGLQQMAAKENPFFAAMQKAAEAQGVRGTSASAAGTSSAKASSSKKGPLDRHEEDEAAREAMPPSPVEAQRAMFEAGLEMMRSGANAWSEAAAKMGAGGAGNPFADFLEPGKKLGEAYQRNIEAILGAGKRPKS
jgi:hypothetical protein